MVNGAELLRDSASRRNTSAVIVVNSSVKLGMSHEHCCSSLLNVWNGFVLTECGTRVCCMPPCGCKWATSTYESLSSIS